MFTSFGNTMLSKMVFVLLFLSILLAAAALTAKSTPISINEEHDQIVYVRPLNDVALDEKNNDTAATTHKTIPTVGYFTSCKDKLLVDSGSISSHTIHFQYKVTQRILPQTRTNDTPYSVTSPVDTSNFTYMTMTNIESTRLLLDELIHQFLTEKLLQSCTYPQQRKLQFYSISSLRPMVSSRLHPSIKLDDNGTAIINDAITFETFYKATKSLKTSLQQNSGISLNRTDLMLGEFIRSLLLSFFECHSVIMNDNNRRTIPKANSAFEQNALTLQFIAIVKSNADMATTTASTIKNDITILNNEIPMNSLPLISIMILAVAIFKILIGIVIIGCSKSRSNQSIVPGKDHH